MYIPKHYLTTDKEEILNFIRTYSFATIISVKDNFPTATHLPFIILETETEIILTSHFAKANTQWTQIMDNQVLIIFSEPHAYISPKNYESEQNVPTWNYISVHVYGNAELITEQNKSFDVLDKMIMNYESEYKKQWDNLPVNFKVKMLNGIVPFQIIVTDVQAKKKLSQNKKETEREKIISDLENSSNNNKKTIAELMKQNENHLKISG